jgi:hypothetical protein
MDPRKFSPQTVASVSRFLGICGRFCLMISCWAEVLIAVMQAERVRKKLLSELRSKIRILFLKLSLKQWERHFATAATLSSQHESQNAHVFYVIMHLKACFCVLDSIKLIPYKTRAQHSRLLTKVYFSLVLEESRWSGASQERFWTGNGITYKTKQSKKGTKMHLISLTLKYQKPALKNTFDMEFRTLVLDFLVNS